MYILPLSGKTQAIFFSLLRKAVIVVPLTFLLPYVGGLGAMGVFAAEPVSNFLGGSACFLNQLQNVASLKTHEHRWQQCGNHCRGDLQKY